MKSLVEENKKRRFQRTTVPPSLRKFNDCVTYSLPLGQNVWTNQPKEHVYLGCWFQSAVSWFSWFLLCVKIEMPQRKGIAARKAGSGAGLGTRCTLQSHHIGDLLTSPSYASLSARNSSALIYLWHLCPLYNHFSIVPSAGDHAFNVWVGWTLSDLSHSNGHVQSVSGVWLGSAVSFNSSHTRDHS